MTFRAAPVASRLAADFLTSNPRCWIISATRAAADDLVHAHGGPGLLGVERMTLLQAAAEIATPRIAGEGLAPLSYLAQEALASRVTHDALKDGALPYFQEVARMPGFGRALAHTLNDLRLAGAAPDDLASQGRSQSDLANLLGRYTRELRTQGLADAATVLRAAAAELKDGGGRRHAGRPLLVLDAPLRHAAQRDFAAALAARAGSLLALYLEADQWSIQVWSELLGAPPVAGGSHAHTQLDTLRAQLFVTDPKDSRAEDGSLEIFSSPGEDLEALEIVRRIHQLAGEGTPFDRMAILLRNPDRYQPQIEDALRRGGIPGYFSRGTARPDPAGRAFLALLYCRVEGLPASRFAEYLSLGQVPPVDENGAPVRTAAAAAAPDDELLSHFAATIPEPEPAGDEEPAPAGDDAAVVQGTLRVPSRWEKLMVDASVVGGSPQRWRSRLSGLAAEIEKRRATFDDPEHPAALRLARDAAQLAHLRRFAIPLMEELAALPDRAAWGEWIGELEQLARRSLRNPATVLAVLAELEAMASVENVSLEEVAGVLAERLRFLRREPPHRRYGHVFVGSVEEARGRQFDIVFLPGLAEGLFPKRHFEDPLLLDETRQCLPGSPATRSDRVAEERLLLHAAASAAARRLAVSFPRMDLAQARPRVPSFYALELPRAAEGRLPPLNEFRQRTESRAPTRLEWPAPEEPPQAVDDFEYDLAAWKQTLNAANAADRKGRLRYILKANQHVARSIRTRWLKWNQPKWTSADGLVDPGGAQVVLEKHRLAERPYSPSMLQQFAACPYRFFLQAIAGLAPREEACGVEQMDPLTRGALFHEVQFETFRSLSAAGLLPFSAWKSEDILAVADQILDRVAAEWKQELAPAIERVWDTEVYDIRADLRGWLHEVIQDADWEPLRFELSFGLERSEQRDTHSSAEPVRLDSGALLRGSIDLVERHRTRGTLRVTDHKTGKQPDAPPAYVGGGQFLQPMLYSWAAEQLLNARVEASRLYFCTQRGGYRIVPVELSERSQAFGRRLLQIVDEHLRDGFLPAAPRKDACQYCDYRPVCGPYEEQRMQRKNPEALEGILEIRRMP